jgi:hypothetical protein
MIVKEPLAACCCQRRYLQIEVLFFRRNASVADLHRSASLEFPSLAAASKHTVQESGLHALTQRFPFVAAQSRVSGHSRFMFSLWFF